MKNVNLIKFKMADLRPLLTLICLITEKSCQMARPLLLNMRQLSTSKCVIIIWKTVPGSPFLWNEMCSFRGKCALKNVRFLRRLCPEKFQQNYILLGRLAVISSPHFNLKSSSALALTFPGGHDTLKSFSCIFLIFVLHLASNQFSDKLNDGRKKYFQ